MAMEELQEIVDTQGIEGKKDEKKERTEPLGSKNSLKKAIIFMAMSLYPTLILCSVSHD